MSVHHLDRWIARGVFLALVVVGNLNSPGALRAGDAASTLPLVTAEERSRHFAAVTSHLELGGTMFGYIDVEGDLRALGEVVTEIVAGLAETQPQMAIFKQDYGALFGELGLDDVKAIGLSSVALTDGSFRNRVFFHTPEGRRGLLAGLGGPAAPFANLRFAPEDTDLFYEMEADFASIYGALRGVVVRIVSEGMAQGVDQQLKRVGAEVGISTYDLIQRAKGRVTVIGRFEGDRTFVGPGPKAITLPLFNVLVRVEGVGSALTPYLAQLPGLVASEEDGRQVFTLEKEIPVPGWAPRVVVDGDVVYVATSAEFLETCRAEPDGLAGAVEFKSALAEIGTEGNGLTFASPRLFARVRGVPDLNPEIIGPQERRFFKFGLWQVPDVDFPLVAVRMNLPDGILYRSRWHTSLKQDLTVLAFYNPATIGLMAAIAIPTIGKVRETAKVTTIRSNLRQLAGAAELYYLEHDVDTVTYDQLVGADEDAEGEALIEPLTSVLGEDYSEIEFNRGEPLRVWTQDGREVVYEP